MKQLLLILLISYWAPAFGQQPVDEIIKELKNPKGNKVLVAAHRGDWRNEPENSIAAIKSAIAMGVDIVEVDIKKTSDGKLVVMHDFKIDRTTTGKGFVKDFTLDSLKKFYLRNGCGVPSLHRIPTLEEMLVAIKGKVLINLDHCYDYINEAYAILEKTGTLNQAIFKGEKYFPDEVKKEYGNVINKITYMPIVLLEDSTANQSIDEYQKQFKPAAFELIFTKDTSSILNRLSAIKDKGSRLWVNSLWPSLNGGHYDDMAYDDGNTKDSWDWLLSKGFTIIQTDRPAALISYLKTKGLHN